MMTTIHQRNLKFPMTMTLLANPLKIHFLEYCQTNISLTRLTNPLILSLLALFSLFLPSTNKSLFENPIFCFHWWLTIHQWTEFQYPIPLMSKFPVLSISPFSAESGQTSNRKVPCFYQQCLGMIQTQVPNSQFSLMTRSELQFS